MQLKHQFLAFVLVIIAVLTGFFFWPQSVGGRIVHGETGEPLQGTRVAVTGVIYKPLAPLIALAWGDATFSKTRVVRSDDEGYFKATFLVGVRLKFALLYMTKRGFVVAPAIEGGSGSANLHAEDFATTPSFPAWPVSSATTLERDGFTRRFHADGREHQVQFGKAHAVWIRADARKRETETAPIPVSIRWVSARIQETDSFALIAPSDGYEREWQGSIDCTRVQPTQHYFSVLDDGNYFGAMALEMQAKCFGGDSISIDYRFAEQRDVRSLADKKEFELAQDP